MKAAAQDRLGSLLAALTALAAWVAGLPSRFVQDDLPLVAQNLRLHALANWREIPSSPFWPPPYSQDLYRPLTALLLALQWALGGGNPLVFRIVSGLLYAGAAMAVLRLARGLLSLWPAVAVALLFAAQPVHVEAEALAAGQSELVVGLLCCIAVTRYLARRRGGGELRARDWLLVGSCYLAGSLFKEQALMLPALLAAGELLLIRDATPRRVRRLLPGYLLLLGLAALVLLARAAALSGNLVGSFTADALTGLSLPERARTMLRVVPEWARLLLWPAHLQADYSPQELVVSTGFGALEALGLLLVLGAVLTAWLARRRAPVLSFGLCWTAIALFPVSNVLVPTGIVLAERTLLLPSIGLLLALGGVLELLGTLPAASGLRRRLVTGSAILLGLAVAAGVLRSVERQGVWRDETRFRLQSAVDAPRSWRTQLSYGTALFELGEPQQAREAYARAASLAPAERRWRVYNDLAQRYFASGDVRAAVETLLLSRQSGPAIEETWHYLVLGYLALGAYPTARAEADSALALGLSPQLFGELRALADTAERAHIPPGGIRIKVR